MEIMVAAGENIMKPAAALDFPMNHIQKQLDHKRLMKQVSILNCFLDHFQINLKKIPILPALILA